MSFKQNYRFPFGKYPAVRISFLIILGILLARLIEQSVEALIICFFSLGFIQLFFEWRNKKWMSISVFRSSGLIFFAIIILFGWIRFQLHVKNEAPLMLEIVTSSSWEELGFQAQIELIGNNREGKIRADVMVKKTSIQAGILSKEKFKARLLLEEDFKFSEGDEITFLGTVIPISEKRNPLQFDYQAFLKSKGVKAQIRLDSLISKTENTSAFTWNRWRVQAQELVDKNFNKKTAPIAKALLLGYKQDLEAESKQAFARSGLSHIMAVSGLHVGFVIAPFWFLIPFIWSKKYGRQIGFVALLLVLFFYAGLTGFSSSVLRASIMAILLTFGKLFYKSACSINLTGAAAVFLLILDPSQLFEIGFQLSFSAVLIILLILPVIQHTLPYWLRIKWYGKPLLVMMVSIVVQLGLYPIQVFYFGEVSLISPIANAIFVPLLGLIVPWALICLLVSSVAPTIGGILNNPSDLFLQGMNFFVLFSSNLDWAWIKATLPSLLFFPFWCAVVFFIASWRFPKLRWKWCSLSLFLLCVIQVQFLWEGFSPKELRVTVFDVGQGDATLVETPNGKKILIDTGVWNPNYDSGESIILPHLKEAGIEKLDAIILSHPHADHIGGILSLIKGIEIETIYNSGYSYDSKLYENYLQLAEANTMEVKSIRAGDRLEIDPAILMLIIGPEGQKFNNDPNQHSIVLNMIYGDSEFLFTGDSGEDQEERLIKNYGDLLDTDFLKVGHHGSRTSSGIEVLERITPEIAVISGAEKNRFNHPHPEAVQRIRATGTELYFTSRDKALIFTSNGKTIQRKKWE